jgi:hypothetical protein
MVSGPTNNYRASRNLRWRNPAASPGDLTFTGVQPKELMHESSSPQGPTIF